ncbi:hypothetical protein [Staphylococcus aureus]
MPTTFGGEPFKLGFQFLYVGPLPI